ncbi:hypothetical protein D3C73_1326520 [compost metagenome]
MVYIDGSMLRLPVIGADPVGQRIGYGYHGVIPDIYYDVALFIHDLNIKAGQLFLIQGAVKVLAVAVYPARQLPIDGERFIG